MSVHGLQSFQRVLIANLRSSSRPTKSSRARMWASQLSQVQIKARDNKLKRQMLRGRVRLWQWMLASERPIQLLLITNEVVPYRKKRSNRVYKHRDKRWDKLLHHRWSYRQQLPSNQPRMLSRRPSRPNRKSNRVILRLSLRKACSSYEMKARKVRPIYKCFSKQDSSSIACLSTKRLWLQLRQHRVKPSNVSNLLWPQTRYQTQSSFFKNCLAFRTSWAQRVKFYPPCR